jgi:hypothetical protein
VPILRTPVITVVRNVASTSREIDPILADRHRC